MWIKNPAAPVVKPLPPSFTPRMSTEPTTANVLPSPPPPASAGKQGGGR